MNNITISAHTCLRCQYNWVPRYHTRTKVCPRCKRRDWDSDSINERPKAKKLSPSYMKRKNWLTK